jgi:CDP-glucose 4,6-dehydratase
MNNSQRLKFWKNRKVFITGHTGFKGSWLIIFLKIFKAKIIGLSLKQKKISLFNQAKCFRYLDKNFYSNINNLKNLKQKIKISEPEIIFHLAAQPLVSESYKNPLKTFKTNILGTANVLEASRQSKSVKVIVIITTDKVYKIKKKIISFRENDELGGKDPYSASKVGSEIVVNSYIESFFNKNKKIKIVTARSGNVIGGGDYSKNRIIPDIINALNKNKEMIVRNPTHIRPWQHVIEPLFGYILLAEKLFSNKIDLNKLGYCWNFGPKINNFISVSKLLMKVNKHKKFKKIKIKKHKFSETKILKLNSKKSIKFLNWRQKWSIDETIRKIIDWNESFKNRTNINKLCIKQIKEYLK